MNTVKYPKTIGVLDRESEVLATLATVEMPESVKMNLAPFSQRELVLTSDALVSTSTCKGKDLADLFRLFATNPSKRKERGNFPGLRNYDEIWGEKESRFWGLAPSALAAEIAGERQTLMASLELARKELEQSGLKESLAEEMTGMRKRRKRKLSDTGGEWDYDRRWDAMPFMGTVRVPKQFQYIEVVFPMNQACMASKEQISMFNARCLALCEILEAAGFRVAITAEHWCHLIQDDTATKEFLAYAPKISPDAAPWELKNMDRVILRDADEYGSVQDFAVLCSSDFYRRGTFSLIYEAYHLIHGLKKSLLKRTWDSYGRHDVRSRPVAPPPGMVVLDHETIGQLFGMSEKTRKEVFQSRVIFPIKDQRATEFEE